MVDKVVSEIGENFRTFGGGQKSNWNPVVNALTDEPLQFAAGVSVKDVVRFVLEKEKENEA